MLEFGLSNPVSENAFLSIGYKHQELKSSKENSDDMTFKGFSMNLDFIF